MRLVVFSDSHGNTDNMIAAVTREAPDQILFLGDGVRDAAALARRFPEIPLRILRGNCDFDESYDESAVLDLEGLRIFAAHGHNHGVKYGMDRFLNSVYFSGARLGLYGHTHRPLWQEISGMQLLNPGSIGDHLFPTYGVISIDSGEFNCTIVDLPH